MAWCRLAPEENRERCSSIAGTSRKSMRSFASLLIVVALGAASAPVVRAQTPSPRTIYTDTLLRERALRHEIETRRSDAPAPGLLERMRALVETYERMARQFPSSGYMDNALWQGALLAADAFWTFGEAEDKTTALEMFSALSSRFPGSALVRESPAHVKRLKAARPTPAPRAVPASVPSPASARVSSSTSSTGRATNALTGVKRDVLPDAVRITLELGQEVN